LDPYEIQIRLEKDMARPPAENSDRVELRIPAEDKALIARAAALQHVNVTSFILRSVLPKARELIAQTERLKLSERDSRRVLDLLENPPAPTERLVRAAKSGKILP
jgi:uncharacterized protein (DUF1778 family)